MNFILEHLEYLIRRHDCVTVPGLGALIVRYRAARFDSRHPLVLLPPGRELAFNAELSESDGLLERSVARRSGVSFEAARRMVAQEVESMAAQLRALGSLSLGRLGELTYTSYGTILFDAAPAARWDSRYYGLRPLYLQNAQAVISQGATAAVAPAPVNREDNAAQTAAQPTPAAPEVTPWEEDGAPTAQERRGRFPRAIVGVAASLAVIISVALFFINPIKVDNQPLMASMAPVETAADNPAPDNQAEVAPQAAPAAPEVCVDNSGQIEQRQAGEESRPIAHTTAPTVARSGEENAAAPTRNAAPTAPSAAKFSDADPFCVIVASFPDPDQAQRYIAENPGRRYGVLQQDGKFRIYAATGASYEEAAAQKQSVGGEGAWICRR